MISIKSKSIELITIIEHNGLYIYTVSRKVHAVVSKFESPAEEYKSRTELNLHSLIVGHESHAIFFARADGNELNSIGIFDGDLLVINRAATLQHESVAVVLIDGEFFVRVYDEIKKLLYSDDSRPIPFNDQVVLEGIVQQSVRCHCKLSNL